MQVAFTKEDVVDPLKLHGSTILWLEEDPILDFDTSDVGADRDDEPVAHHHRAARDHLPRRRDDAGVGDGVMQADMARKKIFRGLSCHLTQRA